MFKFTAVTKKATPAAGSTYRFIGVPASTHPNLGLLIGRRVWRGNKADNARLSIGNVFASLADAKATRAKIVAALGGQGSTPPAPVVPQTVTQNGRTYRLV